MWNVESYEIVANLTQHSDAVNSVTFSRDGKYLATSSNDKTVKLYTADKYQEIATLKGHTNQVIFVAFSADAK